MAVVREIDTAAKHTRNRLSYRAAHAPPLNFYEMLCACCSGRNKERPQVLRNMQSSVCDKEPPGAVTEQEYTDGKAHLEKTGIQKKTEGLSDNLVTVHAVLEQAERIGCVGRSNVVGQCIGIEYNSIAFMNSHEVTEVVDNTLCSPLAGALSEVPQHEKRRPAIRAARSSPRELPTCRLFHVKFRRDVGRHPSAVAASI